MWTKQTVDAMLSGYNADRARAGHLRVEADSLRRLIEDFGRAKVTNAAGPALRFYEGMPRGDGPGDPTAGLALRLASGWEGEDVERLRGELRDVEEELALRVRSVRYVDAWLTSLSEREKWLIQRQVIEGEYWRSILDEYEQRYQLRVSQDSLARLKAKAMGKIYRAAGACDFAI